MNDSILLRWLRWLRCLGFHDWHTAETWIPNFSAPIITRWIYIQRCKRCGKDETTDVSFDERTGQPLGYEGRR